MQEPRISDERLCWLAVQKQITRRTRPSLLMRMFGAATRADDGDKFLGYEEPPNDFGSGMEGRYVFAVVDAAQLLKPEERLVLRQTGQVPGWFLGEVDRGYEELKRSRRES